MRVLVTGVKGQLGYDVVKKLDANGIECRGVDIDDFDLRDASQVEVYLKEYLPDVVVHCGAYTAVDRAEDDREVCYAVNVMGTRNIVSMCKKLGAKLVYISTDYVFSGEGDQCFEIDDQPAPIGYYGETKYLGEKEVIKNLENYYIIRISWVFGINGNNFVKTMMRLGEGKDVINVVSDQIGSPTYTADLAVLIYDMIQTNKFGIYHASNEGYCSWADFAQDIFMLTRMETKVNPIMTEEYPTRALRPKNSKMSKENLESVGFEKLPHWKDALRRYLKELGNYHS